MNCPICKTRLTIPEIYHYLNDSFTCLECRDNLIQEEIEEDAEKIDLYSF